MPVLSDLSDLSLLPAFELHEEALRDEAVHEGRQAKVRWQLLGLRPSDGLPVLAVQRTVAAR
ncbi:MAG: hypothetical protein KC431_19490, partial [Myxococcales bacterium]|nr:hypothetical protein [Myxococcales bacterium]